MLPSAIGPPDLDHLRRRIGIGSRVGHRRNRSDEFRQRAPRDRLRSTMMPLTSAALCILKRRQVSTGDLQNRGPW